MVERETNETAEVLTAREARQGRLGRPVLYVLIGGLALVIIAWVVVGHFY